MGVHARMDANLPNKAHQSKYQTNPRRTKVTKHSWTKRTYELEQKARCILQEGKFKQQDNNF